ncbi:sulfatase-like hydrolase/transferase [Myroides pelagicus]|uniref:LTA synthase family protein n=1 Tax=Myroides pelagicus TaxID=270914 RepID=UPI002DC00711|nr:sulfatase-like hydrolase/transferase [Myroides pelagicus]MEC4114205.1 sulfatase-like hydrolase/transferase [Myroides pelagicus]
MINKFKSHYKPFAYLLSAYLLLNFLLRLVLINHPITTTSFSVIEYLQIFGLGAVRDSFIFLLCFIFFELYYLFLSNSKYNFPYGLIIFGTLLILWGWVTFGHTIFNEYGGVLPEIVIVFISVKTLMFGLCLFLPNYRLRIRQINYIFVLFLFSLIMVQNTISEFFFWNEFGVRYNFIAVDYLVYTNEVIGNIMESYPVIPLFTGVAILTILMTYYIYVQTKDGLRQLLSFKHKLISGSLYILILGLILLAIPKVMNTFKSDNIFTEELSSNGIYKFYTAFDQSTLDYFTFYQTVDDKTIEQQLQQFYPNYKANTPLTREIVSDRISSKKNVVLISIESFSADFMAYYGNENKLTPFLDSLAQKSLFFTNLYATGNRTVRGLEAITMCIPPSPGESVVKRQDNKNKFTTGSIFKENGYSVKYLYGGDAYFDNMRSFFGSNDYEIVDKFSFTPEEITFSNVWGVCDEDMYNKAIQVMDKDYASGTPFFSHIMTISNHRPFTFPKDKINTTDIASSGRYQGVRYTDYAIAQFFKQAKDKPWYDNTVFVILSDHCASSAGKTQLPLDKYRILGLIYDPSNPEGQEINYLTSQIDVMPTLLGILGFNYTSKFIGSDALAADYIPRAFIATYQDLGYIRDNTLTILGVNKKARQYTFKSKAKNQTLIGLTPQINIDQNKLIEAISFYQLTAKELKENQYDK